MCTGLVRFLSLSSLSSPPLPLLSLFSLSLFSLSLSLLLSLSPSLSPSSSPQDRMLSHSGHHTRGRDMFGLCCLPGQSLHMISALPRGPQSFRRRPAEVPKSVV